MKYLIVFLLFSVLTTAFTGCMRGGNADEGDDGMIGDEETTTAKAHTTITDKSETTTSNLAGDITGMITDASDALRDMLPRMSPADTEATGEHRPIHPRHHASQEHQPDYIPGNDGNTRGAQDPTTFDQGHAVL